MTNTNFKTEYLENINVTDCFGLARILIEDIYRDYCKVRDDENKNFLNYSVYLDNIEHKIKLLRSLEVLSVNEYRQKKGLDN